MNENASLLQQDGDFDGWEWAIVEIMGHRRHAGRTREVERFSLKMLRVDVPNKGAPAEHGWATHFYPGSALFCFTPADEATCLRMNRPYAAPARYALTGPDDGDADDQHQEHF